MTNKEIGKRIEAARVSAGLNKKELAQKIKVADSTIKRYEDGEITRIKMPIIESIYKVLYENADVKVLINGLMQRDMRSELDQV